MADSIVIEFKAGRAVDAKVAGFTVSTDQPVKEGGGGTAPTPSEYFLASIATCAALYAKGFCEKRGYDVSGLSLSMDAQYDEKTKMVTRVTFRLGLPEGFPEKYEKAIIRAMDQCWVKKHLFDPPEFETVIEK
jgi:ribosomal protein S12 methylthiotransferase accessory factor